MELTYDEHGQNGGRYQERTAREWMYMYKAIYEYDAARLMELLTSHSTPPTTCARYNTASADAIFELFAPRAVIEEIERVLNSLMEDYDQYVRWLVKSRAATVDAENEAEHD